VNAGNTLPAGGIRIAGGPRAAEPLRSRLRELGLEDAVQIDAGEGATQFRLRPDRAERAMPDGNTLELCRRLGLDSVARDDDLEREILLTMLGGPVAFDYPDGDEWLSASRIRRNIVRAAARTALAFDTVAAQRPADCWTYGEHSGFTVLPGRPLIEALRKATQPGVSGRLYEFSCYRATEYVALLGIAQELAICNPPLLARLQRQWETRALMSTPFHESFLREYGSMDRPLPAAYYVPGDRVWFRNPDRHSAQAEGYEGSWVFYLGGGLFTNFWKRDRPYTMTTKCVEIFHWRDALGARPDGAPWVDDDRVDELAARTLADPARTAEVLETMQRWREPLGIYGTGGGCIDTTRECARRVRPGSSDITLPDA